MLCSRKTLIINLISKSSGHFWGVEAHISSFFDHGKCCERSTPSILFLRCCVFIWWFIWLLLDEYDLNTGLCEVLTSKVWGLFSYWKALLCYRDFRMSNARILFRLKDDCLKPKNLLENTVRLPLSTISVFPGLYQKQAGGSLIPCQIHQYLIEMNQRIVKDTGRSRRQRRGRGHGLTPSCHRLHHPLAICH